MDDYREWQYLEAKNPGYPESFVICGGFSSDSAIPMEKRLILIFRKLISLKPNTEFFLLIHLYITAQWVKQKQDKNGVTARESPY